MFDEVAVIYNMDAKTITSANLCINNDTGMYTIYNINTNINIYIVIILYKLNYRIKSCTIYWYVMACLSLTARHEASESGCWNNRSPAFLVAFPWAGIGFCTKTGISLPPKKSLKFHEISSTCNMPLHFYVFFQSMPPQQIHAWKLNSAALAGEKKSRGTAKACPRSPKIQPWSNDSSHLKVQLLSSVSVAGDTCVTWDHWISNGI